MLVVDDLNQIAEQEKNSPTIPSYYGITYDVKQQDTCTVKMFMDVVQHHQSAEHFIPHWQVNTVFCICMSALTIH